MTAEARRISTMHQPIRTRHLRGGLRRMLRMYWVIHNVVRKHFTTKEVPIVKLGVLEREISVEALGLIHIGS